MNILIVCHYGLYQNLSMSFVHAQVKACAASGHAVKVLVPVAWGKRDWRGSRFAQQPFEQDGVTVLPLRYLSLSNFGAGGFNTRRAIAAIERQYKRIFADFTPDVIHAHTLGFDSDIGAWLKRKLGCPLIVTTHGSDTAIPYERGQLEWLRQQCDRADAVAAVSSALAKKVRESGTETPISVILNGFAPENLPPDTRRQEASVVQVGHLLEQKRFSATIRAFAKLRERHPSATLTLIGQGSERAKLEALCKELAVSDSVRFLGQIPNKDVLSEMSRARFFCMPSVREGFGIVYLEAMANGCITIGTEGEGIADLIENGKNGFLVPPDKPDTIVRVMEWCLAHPGEAQAIAEQGRKDALALTWERNAASYIQLFRSLTSK